MRSDAREAAFKIVFADLFGGDKEKNFRAAVYRHAQLGEEDAAFAERIVSTVLAHKEELAKEIADTVTRFADYRIYPADKAAMLIALAEIRYMDDIPPVVSVSEATAIARKYSTEKSADLVNGVLGGNINKRRPKADNRTPPRYAHSCASAQRLLKKSMAEKWGLPSYSSAKTLRRKFMSAIKSRAVRMRGSALLRTICPLT